MSYILDALKKSQTAQQGDQVALNLSRPVRQIPTWLKLAMTALLVANFSLLVWIFVLKTPTPANDEDQPIAALEPTVPPAEQLPDPPTPEIDRTSTDSRPVRSSEDARPAPGASAPASPESQNQPTRQTTADAGSRAAPAPSNFADTSPTRYQLSELATGERARFEALTYTTHIYTDDPALCAIVINGQRLTQGDSIEGLRVDEITAEGVVFHERVDGRARLVEVSVIAQWES